MPRQTAKTRTALGAAGMAAIAAVAIAVAAAQGAAPADSTEPWWDANRGVVATVQTDQATGFEVFARPRSASDVMPQKARDQVGNSVRSGRNVALSRSVDTPTGTGWAVPGNGTVCLVVPDRVDGYGIVCEETDHARARGLAAIIISPARPTVANLTLLSPRGSRVSATMKDGSIRSLTADRDGVVSVALDGAESVVIETAVGTERLRLPTAPPVPPNRSCAVDQVC